MLLCLKDLMQTCLLHRVSQLLSVFLDFLKFYLEAPLAHALSFLPPLEVVNLVSPQVCHTDMLAEALLPVLKGLGLQLLVLRGRPLKEGVLQFLVEVVGSRLELPP